MRKEGLAGVDIVCRGRQHRRLRSWRCVLGRRLHIRHTRIRVFCPAGCAVMLSCCWTQIRKLHGLSAKWCATKDELRHFVYCCISIYMYKLRLPYRREEVLGLALRPVEARDLKLQMPLCGITGETEGIRVLCAPHDLLPSPTVGTRQPGQQPLRDCNVQSDTARPRMASG